MEPNITLTNNFQRSPSWVIVQTDIIKVLKTKNTLYYAA